METLEIEATLVNETARAIPGAPRLTAAGDQLTLEFTFAGAPLPVRQAIPRPPEKENASVDFEIPARGRETARFTLLYDWDTAAFPFTREGTYTVTATAHAADRNVVVVSAAQSFQVLPLADAARTELMELHATEGYQYSIAPERIISDREAPEKVKKLLAFESAHPASPLIVEFRLIAALYYDFVARTGAGAAADAARVEAERHLKDYISSGRGSRLADARRMLQLKR